MPVIDFDPLAVLSGFADTSAAAVKDLRRNVPHATLRDAVRLIGAANAIAVAGLNRAVPVAACLADGLAAHGRACQLFDSVGPTAIERVSRLGVNDALVAISLSESTCPVMDLVAAARQRRVPVLGIASSAANPLTRHCDVHCVVRSPARHEVQPLAPLMVLVQTLLVALDGERSGEADAPRLNR